MNHEGRGEEGGMGVGISKNKTHRRIDDGHRADARVRGRRDSQKGSDEEGNWRSHFLFITEKCVCRLWVCKGEYARSRGEGAKVEAR
jgi:hypothetical protein